MILNDLWEFDPSTNEWAWADGSSTTPGSGNGQPGVYGTLGTPAAGNIPGSRVSAASWTDSNGNLWLFGGEGNISTSTGGWLNDLWEFSPSTNEWGWMGGSSTLGSVCSSNNSNSCAQPGVYGTLGTPGSGNIPGGRVGALTWTDSNGHLWLFGGFGIAANNYLGQLNDLWEFNPSANEWAWMSGSSTVPRYNSGQPGNYGTLGTSSAGNVPGGRESATTWVDASGHLWLFGGLGTDANGTNIGYLNDLWEFDPSTREWAWMGGSSTVNCGPNNGGFCGNAGTYGASGIPASGNAPGGRSNASSWTDSESDFWLFGGAGFDANGTYGVLNDLWEFNPSTNEWAWMGGSNTVPGFDEDQPGVYGILGTPAAGNVPGGRAAASSWTDSKGHFWLFGGNAFNANGFAVGLNDMWEYQSYAITATPAFSVAAGTYTSVQSVTISDSTTGAAIYYTTDGKTTPTTNSTKYAGAITVSSSETIQAIAAASDYSASNVASVAYTINLPAPDFTMAASPTSITVTAGQSGTASISVTPANGFNSAVTFSCSGLPSGASCNFSPTTVTPSGAAALTTLTVTIAKTSAALRHEGRAPFPEAILAAVLCCVGWKQRRRFQMLLLLALSVASLSLLTGCGGGASASGPSPTPQPVTTVISVTATSGALQHSATISLTVN